jgi:acyl carrier protein
MTHDEVLAKLKEILQADFRVPPEKVVPTATFRGQLGMDSLDAVDLIYLLGKAFNVKADVESFRDLDTVQKVVDYLVKAPRK